MPRSFATEVTLGVRAPPCPVILRQSHDQVKRPSLHDRLDFGSRIEGVETGGNNLNRAALPKPPNNAKSDASLLDVLFANAKTIRHRLNEG